MIAVKKMLEEFKPEVNFENHDDFIEAALLDSLDIIQLTAKIENDFSLTIPDHDMIPENFMNFQKICELIDRAKKENT